MYELSKTFRFEASHVLPQHAGKCARLHGHSWIMSITIQGDTLISGGPGDGMLMDFSAIKEMVQPIVDQYLDHYHLNESTSLYSPTSENLAKWCYERIAAAMTARSIPTSMLKSVRIEETCTSACTYTHPESPLAEPRTIIDA